MPKIKPPRKPRGENRAVTIKVQEGQIRMLVDRVEALSQRYKEMIGFRDKWQQTADDLQAELEARNALSKDQDRDLAAMERVHDRMLGWQDCAREMMKMTQTGVQTDPPF